MELTYEQKLNKALSFLSDNQMGSFMYYKPLILKEDRNNNYPNDFVKDQESRLIKYFNDIEISDKEHLPIIDQLIRDGYVDAFYSVEKPKELGNLPLQIKITYTGLRFCDQGGYKKIKPPSIFSKYKEVLHVTCRWRFFNRCP